MRVIVDLQSRLGRLNTTHIVSDLTVNSDGSITLVCMPAAELGGRTKPEFAPTFTLERSLVRSIQDPAMIAEVKKATRKR